MLTSNLSNPPHFFKAYKSNINRAPRKKFFKITKGIKQGSGLKILSKNFNMNNNLLLFKKNNIDNIILEKNTAVHVANRIRA